MTEIPLVLRLKKQIHKDIAAAQDIIVNELYKIFDRAVIHGGTAIWRCYHGNRFSEDIDVYIQRDENKLDVLFDNLKKAGFFVVKKKISEKSIYASLSYRGTIVRFEALFIVCKDYVLKEYLMSDGNYSSVYSLSPESLVREKVDTYLKRFKVRDLYDVFFLLRLVGNIASVRDRLLKLVKTNKKPLDEKDLSVIIIDGIVPPYEKMIENIRSRL